MTENAVTKMEAEDAVPSHRQDQEPTNLLSIIKHIATNDQFDVEKMKALLEMRAQEEDRVRRIEREDRDEASKRAWLRDFSKVQAKIGPIVRSRANDHTRSRYADLADIERIVTPILTEYGFSTTCVPVPCDLQDHIRMRLTLGHSEGHERHYEDNFPLDAAGSGGKVNKTPIQAKGSTETYARRYLKASALDLAFMDDNDGNTQTKAPSETITEEQYIELRELIEKAGITAEIVCEAEKLSNLPELPASAFQRVRGRLQTTIKDREKKA